MEQMRDKNVKSFVSESYFSIFQFVALMQHFLIEGLKLSIVQGGLSKKVF